MFVFGIAENVAEAATAKRALLRKVETPDEFWGGGIPVGSAPPTADFQSAKRRPTFSTADSWQ